MRRASLAEWLRLVDEPGSTGPWEPEEGYEVFVAEKREEIAVGGAGIDLHFQVGVYRWRKGAWQRRGTTAEVAKKAQRGADPDELSRRQRLAGGGEDWWQIWPHLPRDAAGNVIADAHGNPVPAPVDDQQVDLTSIQSVWPATTPVDELAEAWFEYRQRVRDANHRVWERRVRLRREAEERLALYQAIDEQARQAVSDQRGVAELLPGPTLPGRSLWRR